MNSDVWVVLLLLAAALITVAQMHADIAQHDRWDTEDRDHAAFLLDLERAR